MGTGVFPLGTPSLCLSIISEMAVAWPWVACSERAIGAKVETKPIYHLVRGASRYLGIRDHDTVSALLRARTRGYGPVASRDVVRLGSHIECGDNGPSCSRMGLAG